MIPVIFIFSGCDDTETLSQDFVGTLEGQVYLYAETGLLKETHEDVLVQLVCEGNIYSATTNAEGIYKITDIPSGTYNLIFTKNGYGEYQEQGFAVLGGDVPVHHIQDLKEISKTKIENLQVNFINGDFLLSGIIYHNYVLDKNDNSGCVPVRFIMYSSPGIEEESYLGLVGTLLFKGESGSEFTYDIHSSLPEYDTLYIVAFGINYGKNTSYNDIFLEKIITTTQGEFSNYAILTNK